MDQDFPNRTENERLAIVEAKVGLILDSVQEIRTDIRNQPTKAELDSVKEEVTNIKSKYSSILLKVGIISSVLGIVTGSLLKVLFK